MRKQTAQFALAGLVGIAVSAYVVSRAGRAGDFFLPGLMANAGYALAYAISIAVRRPLLGVFIAIASNRGMEWRQDPARVRAYSRASWVWVGLFSLRRAVQLPLYLTGAVVALGVHACGDGRAAVHRRDLAELADPPHASRRLKPIPSRGPLAGDEVPDRTAGEALQSAWEVEAKPARDVLRQGRHDDLVEALRVPNLLDRQEWIGVAHHASRRDPGVAKTGERGSQATTS